MINANPMPRYTETAETSNILNTLIGQTDEFAQGDLIHSSNMPLDTEAHWRWSNPLNLIVLGMVALFVLAIVGSIVSMI